MSSWLSISWLLGFVFVAGISLIQVRGLFVLGPLYDLLLYFELPSVNSAPPLSGDSVNDSNGLWLTSGEFL